MADADLQNRDGISAAKKVANAQDEATLYVYVPRVYAGHWDHFAGLLRHLYVNGDNQAFAALKARQLAVAAVQPHAYLQDISYAWEALGRPALFALDPLLTDARPNVRFAAARAAAFIGDPAAVPVLLEIANRPGDEFRLNAVLTLGELPMTPRTDALCRGLLDSDEATVRIAAYQMLSRHGDPSIYTRWITDGDKQIFALDVIRGHGGGKPMVYITQQGLPRVAVFGTGTAVDLPVILQTLDDDRLMIGTTPDGDRLSVSYRSPYRKDVVGFTCGPTLPELIARLAGDGGTSDATAKLHLGYADVVAVLQDAGHPPDSVSGPAGGELGGRPERRRPRPGRPAGAGVVRARGGRRTSSPCRSTPASLVRGQNGGGRPSSDTPGSPGRRPPTAPPTPTLLRRTRPPADPTGGPRRPPRNRRRCRSAPVPPGPSRPPPARPRRTARPCHATECGCGSSSSTASRASPTGPSSSSTAP